MPGCGGDAPLLQPGTWHLTILTILTLPSYFTWLFTILNEKEQKREKKWSYREGYFHRFSRTFSPANSSEYSQNRKISQWSGDFLADQFNTTPKSSCTEHQVYTWLFLLFLLFLLCLIVYDTKWKRAKKEKRNEAISYQRGHDNRQRRGKDNL